MLTRTADEVQDRSNSEVVRTRLSGQNPHPHGQNTVRLGVLTKRHNTKAVVGVHSMAVPQL